MAEALKNLAAVLYQQERFGEAKPLYRRARLRCACGPSSRTTRSLSQGPPDLPQRDWDWDCNVDPDIVMLP
ncbi:hypothetical protein HYH03_009097 [Edaphochlamys debaryana]|uniref:Uncharacterized protein n=1 Tax=Edaphochlamys debaryana TaxID=47281 RepID=A0A835XZX2_9CHLO|nr:hypothetical protein HYH03_009097 [Edaphochlamys debaryana]|eukprot:KAG2492682.1 hypothetical protein HYH03_009097 [Edaphochlamys debaryana]